MKKYIEIGIGNRWPVRTEIENEDGTETEHPGIEHLRKIDGVYLRLWIGRTVFVISSNEGWNVTKKNRRAFKLLLGIAGT